MNTYIIVDNFDTEEPFEKTIASIGDKPTIVNRDKNKSIPQLFNEAVEEADSEYVTLVTSGTEFETYFQDLLEQHIKGYPKIPAFLPIIASKDYQSNDFLGFKNAVSWSNGYNHDTEKIPLGNLSIDFTKRYIKDTSGAVLPFSLEGFTVTKSFYQNCGGLKSNIKFSYFLEFLLRFMHKTGQVKTMNKMGLYQNLNIPGTESALMKTGEISYQEFSYWLDVATSDYKTNHDGNKFGYKAELESNEQKKEE